MLLLLTACGFSTIPGKDDLDLDTGAEAFGDLSMVGTVDFGFVELGEVGQQSLVITNTGETPISLEDAIVESDVFRLAAATSLPELVLARGELVLDLEFEPQAQTSYTEELVLTTDASGVGEITIQLKGTAEEGIDTGPVGDGATIEVSTSSIDFGDTDIGKLVSESVTLANTGNEDLLVVNISSDTSEFGWGKEFTLPYVLPAGEERSFSATYKPSDEKTDVGVLTVSSDAENEPQAKIDVTGKGFHGCTVCAPLISVKKEGGGGKVYEITDFLILLFGNEQTQGVQVWNEGDEPLKITDIKLTNDSNAVCTYTMTGWGGGPWTIDPWNYNQLNVTFTATGLCLADGAELVLSSNDPNEGTYLVNLQGSAFIALQ